MDESAKPLVSVTQLRFLLGDISNEFLNFTIQAQEEQSHRYALDHVRSLAKGLMELALMDDDERRSGQTLMLKADYYSVTKDLWDKTIRGGRSHYALRRLCKRTLAVLELIN